MELAASQSPPPSIVQISLTEEERISGIPTPPTIEKALGALHRDGIVVLNNAVDVAHLDILNNRMTQDLEVMLQEHRIYEIRPVGCRNYVQFPPMYPEYMFADVFANPIVRVILSNILGPDPELHFVATNSLAKGEARQPVHADMLHEHLDFPFAMTVNMPFVDTSLANGATEFWLGTHHYGNKGIKDPQLDGPWIDHKYLTERGLKSPPIRPPITKGSVVIRDLRLWHAGINNQTDTRRLLLSLIYFAKWYRNPMVVTFPEKSRSTVEKFKGIAAKFVPDAEYNHETLIVQADNNSGNREMTPEEMVHTVKYGKVDPSL